MSGNVYTGNKHWFVWRVDKCWWWVVCALIELCLTLRVWTERWLGNSQLQLTLTLDTVFTMTQNLCLSFSVIMLIFTVQQQHATSIEQASVLIIYHAGHISRLLSLTTCNHSGLSIPNYTENLPKTWKKYQYRYSFQKISSYHINFVFIHWSEQI